jgi:hypothetical protein
MTLIVLLMAMFLPALRCTRRQTRAVLCQANLRQWGAIFALYTEDNQGKFPRSSREVLNLMRGTIHSYGESDIPSVYYYVRSKEIACCPLAVKPGTRKKFRAAVGSDGGFYRIEGTSGSTFEAWEVTNPLPRFRGSYGINYNLFDHNFDTSISIRKRLPWRGMDVFSVRNRVGIPTLLDCKDPWERFHNNQRPPLSAQGRGSCINRHKAYVNCLFLDWSTRRIGLKELWTLKWNGQFDTENAWTTAGGVRPEDWPSWMRGFKDY